MSILDSLGRLTGDDYSTTPVPNNERLMTFIPTMAWTGFAMFMPTYIVGAQLGVNTGSIAKGFAMIIVGTLFLAAYLSLHGVIGIRTGYSCGMLASYSFGRKGAVIPAFNFGDAGWACVIIGLFAWLTADKFGLDPRVVALGSGVLMLTATFIGLKGAFWVNMVQFIIMVFVGVLGVAKAFTYLPDAGNGFAQVFAMTFPDNISWALGVTMVVGLFANGSSRGADVIRWCQKPLDGWKVGMFAFGVGAMFCSLSGAIIAACTGMTDTYSALVYMGMPIGAILIFFCLSWTTTDMSGYASSLGMACIPKLLFNKEVSRRPVAIVLSAIIVTLAATGLYKYLEQWLIVMGTLFPAMGGIMFADYYIMNKTKYHWIEKDCYTKYLVDDPEIAKHSFNWLTLPGLIGGGAFGYYTATVHIWGIPPINSIVLSMLLYIASCVIAGVAKSGNKDVLAENSVEG